MKQIAQSWTSMTIIQYRPDKNFKFRPSTNTKHINLRENQLSGGQWSHRLYIHINSNLGTILTFQQSAILPIKFGITTTKSGKSTVTKFSQS
jgi:hypothetical protein